MICVAILYASLICFPSIKHCCNGCNAIAQHAESAITCFAPSQSFLIIDDQSIIPWGVGRNNCISTALIWLLYIKQGSKIGANQLYWLSIKSGLLAPFVSFYYAWMIGHHVNQQLLAPLRKIVEYAISYSIITNMLSCTSNQDLLVLRANCKAAGAS